MAVNVKLKTIEVLLSKIEMHPDLEDHRLEVGDIRGLAQSIKENGLQEPIGVNVVKDNYYLVYGKRRFMALQQLKKQKERISTVTCVVVSGKPADLFVNQLIENLQRKDFTVSELSSAIKDLLEKGYNQSSVAKVLGKSRSWISRIIGFTNKASESLQKAVNVGTIGFNKASDISELPTKKQEALVSRIVEQGESKEKVSRKAREMSGKKTTILNEKRLRFILDGSQTKLKELGQRHPDRKFCEAQIKTIEFIVGDRKTLPVVVPTEIPKPVKKKKVAKKKKKVIKKGRKKVVKKVGGRLNKKSSEDDWE